MQNKKPKLSVVVPLGPNNKLSAQSSIDSQEEPVLLLVEKGKNPSRNRNLASSKATTPYTAFINSHSILPKDWSKRAVSFLEENKSTDIVGGPQLTPESESTIGRISGYALSSIFGAAEVSTRYKPKSLVLDANEKLLTSANLVCRSSVLKKVKFREDLWPAEDPQFITDSKNAGFKVAYNPDLIVYHKRRSTLPDFAKQIFNYGFMRPKKEPLTQTLKNPSFLVPSAFTIYLALFPLLFLLTPLFLIPLVLYLILSISFTVFIAAKNLDLLALILLPFIFFTIHIVYGLGIIWGTLTK